MKIKEINIDELIMYENNPRNNDEAGEYVIKSIEQFGFKEDICLIDNKYIVSKSGKVYTIYYSKKGIQEQKLRKHTNGYLRATIFGKDMYVHRLVAMCFIPNENNYTEISHEDNDKTNNNVNNLKWCTRSYNNKKMFLDGIKTSNDMQKISSLPKPKSRRLTEEDIRKIRNSSETDTVLAQIFNAARGVIYQIRKFKTYKEVI